MTQHQHDAPDLPEVLTLEAEALSAFTAGQALWVAQTVGAPARHVVDLGSGTGAGTFALMERFPHARVTAVDSSPVMLERLAGRAADLGEGDRLTAVRADLDVGLPPLRGVDLVWASSAVHHLGDPDRLIAEVAALLPAGGWFVVVEAEDVPWFLPDEIGTGRPGLERRCHEVLSSHRRAAVPEVGADWGARLAAAGLDVTATRAFETDPAAALPEATRCYARSLFGMFRHGVADHLDAADLAALDVLLDDADPRGLARREDLTLRTTRTAWAAQRPAAPGARTATSTTTSTERGREMTDDTARVEREAFRQQRLAMLTGLGGSLSMVAMPAVPATPTTFAGLPGTWGLQAGQDGVQVTAVAVEGVRVDGDLLDGTAPLGPASAVRFSGTVTAGVVREVDGTWYLQVSDAASPHLAAFAGLEVYDHDPAWVLDATYRSRPEAERATTAGRLGSDEQHRRDSPGDLEITVDGRVHRLAVYASFVPGVVTVNFTDTTSGSETPRSGRLVVLPAGADGPVVLDLNGAMLLPHESSSVYPCPAPPVGNHLPVPVRAGEKAVRFTR